MYRRKFCWRCGTSCSSHCSRCGMAFYCGKQCQKADKWRHKVDCDAACLKRACATCQKITECRECGSCMNVWYCSVECQRTHHPEHKADCQTKRKTLLSLANRIKRDYEIKSDMEPGLGNVYYWGNVPAADLINLEANEETSYRQPLDLLLCGVGDPRNVILTLASLPACYTEKITFVLNDICACVLARTVLLLYMLYKGENESVSQPITQIWYSIYLCQSHFELLLTTLKELVNATDLKGLTDGIFEIPKEQFRRLQKVWKTWLEMSCWTEPWIEEQRNTMFSIDPLSEVGKAVYVNEVPAEHKASCKEWFASGILLPLRNRDGLVKENVTLAGSGFQIESNQGQFQYCITSDILPFTGWDYTSVKKFCYKDCVQEMYCDYVCHVLEKSKAKLMSGQIKFQIVLFDCMKMKPFLSPEVKYDRILTSNLSDFIPIGDLLLSFKPLLKETNKCAVMVTETLNWMTSYFSSKLQDFEMSILFWNLKESEAVMKDTKNRDLARSNCKTAHIEYWDLTEEFKTYLQASLLACDSKFGSLNRSSVPLPSITRMTQSYGVVCRKFLRNENLIMPFRWAVNCRRVTMINGLERTVEWVLLPESES